MHKIRFVKFVFILAAFAAFFVLDANGQILIGKRASSSIAVKSKMIDAKKLLHDIEYLSSDEMEGRSADRPSMQKARDYIEKRFKESGLRPMGKTYRSEFEIAKRGKTEKLNGVNFVGTIKGSKSASKYIVITAHYDHVGMQSGDTYNGADDNASGTAALFAVASYFKKNRPEHSLIFAAFDAEEKGLQGAKHFVANLLVAKESIVLNVNMDMLSRSDKGELYAVGTLHYSQFIGVLEKVKKKARIKLLRGHDIPGTGQEDWTNQSDHAAFHAAKIPFIYFGVEDHKDYHKPTDDFANIQPEFYVKAVETVLNVIEEINREKWGSGIGISYSE